MICVRGWASGARIAWVTGACPAAVEGYAETIPAPMVAKEVVTATYEYAR